MSLLVKATLSLGALCMAVLLGVSTVHSERTRRHMLRLQYAANNEMPEKVVAEYHSLPIECREKTDVKAAYAEACRRVGDVRRGDDSGFRVFLPTTEKLDIFALAVFAVGIIALCVWMPAKRRGDRKPEAEQERFDAPSESQLSILRRINNGIVPFGLTRPAAAVMIRRHFARVGAMQKRQQVDVRPIEFMSPSQAYRERMKVERERRRAQETLAREREREERRREREEQRAVKAQKRLFDKRIAEEERLLRAREDAESGIVRKARNAKAQTIQEFQDLVNGILADKMIEPQEVRQLKAWLMAHRQSPADFGMMFKVIDESLVDGIIDADETQTIYEGIIDCLITLRERR